MTTTAEHLRNTLDGRWRDMKNRMREELSNEVFRPHYTPNTVIARTKVGEQMKIMAANGAAEDGFKKEHGGNGDVGAAVTQIEMLAMSDLSLMVKAGVQWGLFGGAIENLGTERHHEAYVQRIIDLDLLGCFAMTETVTAATCRPWRPPRRTIPRRRSSSSTPPPAPRARTTSAALPKPRESQLFSRS